MKRVAISIGVGIAAALCGAALVSFGWLHWTVPAHDAKSAAAADRLCPPPQKDAFNLAGASNIISEQESSVSDRRELYQSSNGDRWFLGRDPSSGGAVVIHEPNRPSGAHTSCIGLGDFLRRGDGPEQQALLRLIATLVDVPPYTART